MKRIITILLLLAVIIYVFGLIDEPFLFIVAFATFSLTLLITALFAALLLITNLICRFFLSSIRKMYAQYKVKIIFLATATFILFTALFIFINSNINGRIEISSREALKSLSYLTWVPVEQTLHKSGVTKYDQEKPFNGINIYPSANSSAAYLMDMSGNILHTWSEKTNQNYWHHIEMCENGDLLVCVEDGMLIRLDWDSNIKWIKKMRFHHDIAIAQNQDIYAFARKDEVVFKSGLPAPILNDYIIILSANGEIKKEICLFKILKKEISFKKLMEIYYWIIKPSNLKEIIKMKIENRFIFKGDGSATDIFHTNTIEIINRDIEGLCKKGNLLVSFRQLDLIAILDIEKEEIIWKYGPGYLDKQHHPTLLGNGNILIFDNGCRKKYSRIIELNPNTKEIVWEYKANPPEQFYSGMRGSSQRLPNGNTLIAEGDKGRVFEVTKDGEVVWEFYNPEIKKDKKKRAVIYRMMRITDPENYSRLEELKQ